MDSIIVMAILFAVISILSSAAKRTKGQNGARGAQDGQPVQHRGGQGGNAAQTAQRVRGAQLGRSFQYRGGQSGNAAAAAARVTSADARFSSAPASAATAAARASSAPASAASVAARASSADARFSSAPASAASAAARASSAAAASDAARQPVMRSRLVQTDMSRPALERETLTPTLPTAATPFTQDDFAGSMAYHSTEGEDPCHESELSPAARGDAAQGGAQDGARFAAQTPPTRVLPMPLTRDALVQAVVMSEILTRPADRPSRRRGLYGHV